MNVFAALVLLQVATAPPQGTAQPRAIAPVLEFPEPELDDSSAYEGYRTRFYRDTRGNVMQVYVNQRHGRIVNLLANAANESASLTVRDTSGNPASVRWSTEAALARGTAQESTIEYTLETATSPLEIGRFLLGSMRLERDFQYQEGHLQPFDAPSIQQPELLEAIAHIERLQPAERRSQLALLNATSVQELRQRLVPIITISQSDSLRTVRVTQPSFDGRNRLTLELHTDARETAVTPHPDRVVIRSRSGQPLRLVASVTTDATALTPLDRDQIFSDGFLRFFERARQEHARIADRPVSERSPGERDRALRFRRLERQIRSLEVMSYEEKLMAGLPNYATYFGRDMLMSALMMQPIWTGAMAEHVIASVLRKLTSAGEVSHEEALGGQAIRENAAEYNARMTDYFAQRDGGEAAQADSALARAHRVLGNLQSVRENYVMVDDDFQFPVLVARYLADERVPAERKRAFLDEPALEGGSSSRLTLLLRNMEYVARTSEPYAREPAATNLVSFPARAAGGWFPGSWRDSNAGYGGGRYAMDINAVWVPAALESLGSIISALHGLGFDTQNLEAAGPTVGSVLERYIADTLSLIRAIESWRTAEQHFWVRLSAEQVHDRVRAKLASLPQQERLYWQGLVAARGLGDSGIEFLALSLDSTGTPVPVVNTDPATRLFLEPLRTSGARELRDIRALLVEYPVGLLVTGLGPLVANDAYASPEIWENFRRDHYHSPRVVWGREVNLLLLGLTGQINGAFDASGNLREPGLEPYVRALHEGLTRTLAAVEQSGLKHNELWTYRIDDGRLVPLRYAASTDIQLWNLTDLAVQYGLSLMPAALRTSGVPQLYQKE
ncbi:hypothetical protein BH23GEM2_BH23GEM2_05330 [soil metagenome]